MVTETIFQKQVLTRLGNMEKTIHYIIGYIEDSRLSRDDRRALKEALKEEKEGKLLTKEKVFS